MKKRWTDYLPAPLYDFLIQVRYILRKIFFPLPCAIFARLPIQNNKIVFDNYMGKGFGDNPKYVLRELLRRGDADTCDLVWLISRRDWADSELPPQVRTVRFGSLRSLYECATAKIWVSNYHKISFLRCGLHKRKDQFFIQMWHGSLGIKKIDGDVAALTQDKPWLRAAMANSRMTDFWISNSSFETNVYKTAFWDVRDETILLYGHPRNDIFFDAAEMQRARKKVNTACGTQGKRLLLYAPTFREDHRADCYKLDYAALVGHIEQRFGGQWTVLVRLHPRMQNMAADIIPSDADVADVTQYTDMQELLAAADCLVTDYSSCAFDFMLTRRPVFLFATDVQEYDAERGFYYPLEATPFPVAHDNAELMQRIDGFDADAYAAGVEAFLQEKGCIEDGHASERVADLVEKLVQPAENACL